jgi:hypothetical protein
MLVPSEHDVDPVAETGTGQPSKKCPQSLGEIRLKVPSEEGLVVARERVLGADAVGIFPQDEKECECPHEQGKNANEDLGAPLHERGW